MSAWTRFKEAIGGPRILYEETLEEASRASAARAVAPAIPTVAEPFAVAKDGGITIVVESADATSVETLDDARRTVAEDLNALADRLAKSGVRLRAVAPETLRPDARPR